LKQGDALSLLLFNLSLEYAIGKDQENQEVLELNRMHQLLIKADDDLLGKNIYMINKNTNTIRYYTEIGLEINDRKKEANLHVSLAEWRKKSEYTDN
jgi:hypothetical protein